MTCLEFQELMALYALDALEAKDRAAADSHLAQETHQGCLEALARCGTAADALARALEAGRPSEEVWRKIAGQLPVAPKLPAAQRARSFGSRAREPLAWGIAAAAAVTLFLVQGGRMRELREGQERESQLALARSASDRSAAACKSDLEAMRGTLEAEKTAVALLRSPSARLVPLGPVPNAKVEVRASALIDVVQKRGMLVSAAGQLPQPASGVYELWLIRGKAPPIPAGLLKPGTAGVLADIAPALLAEGAPDAVAISLEPGPGPSATPTSVLALGAFPKS